MFQSSLPMLPLVQNEVQRLLKLFIARFMKTETVRSVNDFTTLNFNDSQAHLSDQDMSIEYKTWAFLDAEDDLIDATVKQEFFKVSVYSTVKACTHNTILWISVSEHVSCTFSTIPICPFLIQRSFSFTCIMCTAFFHIRTIESRSIHTSSASVALT